MSVPMVVDQKSRARFIIRGKPGFIQAVIEDLKSNGTIDGMY